jgi:methyl-accepting chemotaxis protein
MRFNPTIAAKLAVAYSLFLLPIGYLGYKMIAAAETSIGFANKEIVGVHYIADVRRVQDAIVRGSDMATLVGQAEANQRLLGANLETAEATSSLAKALREGNRATAAQAAADLISKAADGSNLTLDPDLDSFYTQDVLTVKVPTAVAGVAGLAAAVADTAGHDRSVADEINIGVLTGALQPTLDGLATDIDSAIRGNNDKTVSSAMAGPVEKVAGSAKITLAALSDHARAAEAQSIARPLLDTLMAAGAADAAEVEHLLNARIAGLRWHEMIDGAVAVMLFLTALGYVLLVVQRGAITPLRALTNTMNRLAAHDLTAEIGGQSRRDEVGDMARAVLVFKDNMIDADRLSAAKAKEQAAKDRRQAAIDAHIQDFGTSISGVMASLGQSAGKMHGAADEMSAAATRTRESASDAVDGANSAARDLNSVAVAAEQMAASISEISRQVSHVTTATQKAVERAGETDTKVASLATAADRIGDVVRLISTIAAQTNLLALNATIEAARAGEAGKGFAVVASEVKTLASQTARATDQISSQIIAIRAATEEAVGAVRQVGTAIGDVDAVASAIAAAVEEQAAATQEISSSVQSVTRSTTTVAQSMEAVTTISQQTDVASRSVLTASGEVSTTADTLRVEVNDFLNAMKNGDERRAYERIPGAGATAHLTIPGQPEVRVTVRDISRGGVALVNGSTAPSGTEVQVGLPTGGRVFARIVRSEPNLVTMAFRQDAASMALIDRTIEEVKRRTLASAA